MSNNWLSQIIITIIFYLNTSFDECKVLEKLKKKISKKMRIIVKYFPIEKTLKLVSNKRKKREVGII